MVASDHPVELLTVASQIIEIATERPVARLADEPRQGTSLAELVDSFVGVDRPETTALLVALGLLLPDELLAARCRREVANRPAVGPQWLQGLSVITTTGVMVMTHVLGDGDNVLIGCRWLSGAEMTVVVYIDHNVGQLVKDAFVIPAGLDEAVASYEQLIAGEPRGETTFEPLDPADARAQVTDAIFVAERTILPFTSESWPACRSLVEWVVRQLPEGGKGYERREWTAEQQDQLVNDFFASPAASALRDDDARRFAAENLVWMGCNYGPGDPLRWSPVSVEIVLVDRYPRKVVAPLRRLAVMPEVLRAFVTFAHQARGIPAHLTEETLASVDLYEPEFQRNIRAPRSLDAETIAQVLREAGYEDLLDDDDEDELSEAEFAAQQLERLVDEVGGQEILDQLDVEPLPDEDFAWEGIDADLRPRLEAILELADRCCDELFDHEYRTIARRVLARAARNDPGVVGRSDRDDKSAAALIWLIGKPNDMFNPYAPGGLFIKDLLAWFGLAGSVSKRGRDLREAAGLGGDFHHFVMRDRDLLHSRQRARVIERRDHFRSWLSTS